MKQRIIEFIVMAAPQNGVQLWAYAGVAALLVVALYRWQNRKIPTENRRKHLHISRAE